ncbi:MAG: hypothetical protein MUP36_02610 [Demequinaceae bacterium]|nr:hypothetical protein [Demequinaceae bacterium]
MAILATIGAAITWGPDLWHRYGDRLFSTESCTAAVDGYSSNLTAEQADNAALIVAVGIGRGLPERATTIALAAALQESDLRNLRLGDRDSLGLFQQRPSQGWGTPEQIMDPHYATNSFYDALLRVEDWESMSVTEAAQAVQRSGFPNAYAGHEARAELWAVALSGRAGIGAVTCSLDPVTPSAAPDVPFLERLDDDFGAVVDSRIDRTMEGHVIVTLWADPATRDAIASWTVIVASTHPVEEVTSCGMEWTRESGRWERGPESTYPSVCPSGEVSVLLTSN